jgi:hypothetical protein
MYVPWPTIWRRFRNRGSLVLIGLIFFVAVCLLLTVAVFTTGNPWLSLLILLFTVTFGTLGVSSYLTTGMCAQRGSGAVLRISLRDDRSAIFLPTLKAATALVTIACVVLSAALLFFPWLMDRVPTDGTWRDAQLRAWAPGMPIFGVLMLGWSLLGRIVRKRGALGIGLSPEGSYHWARFGAYFYAWDSITKIRPTAHGAPRVELDVDEPSVRPDNAEENWVAKLPSARRSNQKLAVTGLVVNPGVAYIALVFYHRHPELRHELAGEAAVTRIQKMDFPELIRELEARGELRSSSR